jgi:transposase
MPQNFLAADRDQPLLLPPDLRDWLDEDHLAWFVIEAIEELDLDAFYAAYRADGHGHSAHDPKMMVTCSPTRTRSRSSRGTERRCREDVAFRVITANQAPDHATIARFRVRHETALADLFSQVLGLCAQAGLVEVGVLAVDGTKLAASASNHSTRSYEQIAQEILAEAGRIDAAEDEIHGEARGDELPEHLASREGRRAWLREAKERLEQERAAKAEAVPRERHERLELCHRRLVEDWRTERRANRDYEAYRARGVMKDGRRFGRPPDPHTPPPQPEGKINTTDPDSKNMKAFRGYVQGYNAQAVTTERQIIVAAEIAADGLDFAQLDPMVTAAERELERAGVKERPGVVLADAGYWSNAHLDRLRERRITPIVAPRRPQPRRAAKDAPRRALRLHAQGPRHRPRCRALLTAPMDGGAGLRGHQAEPARGAVQTAGLGGRPLGMAPDRGHPQPPEAPPALPGHRGSLIAARKDLPVFRSSRFHPRPLGSAGFTRQPPRKAEAASELRLISKDAFENEHLPARNQVRQVILQALHPFLSLLLPALDVVDLCDQHVIG